MYFIFKVYVIEDKIYLNFLQDDFVDNKEFIILLVYKSEGKKVFYFYSFSFYKDGVRINTSYYFCKMVEEKGIR